MSINYPDITYEPEIGAWQIDKLHEDVLQSDYNINPIYRAKRFQSSTRSVTQSILFSYAEYQTFLTFYETTLRYGLKKFLMQIFTGSGYSEKLVRFSEPPKEKEASYDRISVSMKLEFRG